MGGPFVVGGQATHVVCQPEHAAPWMSMGEFLFLLPDESAAAISLLESQSVCIVQSIMSPVLVFGQRSEVDPGWPGWLY